MTVEVSLENQLVAVEREIISRRCKFRRWVAQGKINQARAAAAIDDMRAVAKSLRELAKIKEAMQEEVR